jgi:hypothetical protein
MVRGNGNDSDWAICFSDSIKIAIAEGLARFIPITADLLSERLPTFTFVTFVALMEGWIWVQRAKVSVALDLLEQLSTKFTLEPIRLAIEK